MWGKDMSHDRFRRVFTIPSTPFAKNGDIDWRNLKQVIDFCGACGAHGIVWPANASGFPVLGDEERGNTGGNRAGRRAHPGSFGCSRSESAHAAIFSHRAQELRADGVIAMEPYARG